MARFAWTAIEKSKIIVMLAMLLLGLVTGGNSAQTPRSKISGALQQLLSNQGNPAVVQALGKTQGVEVKGSDQRLVVVVEGVGDLGSSIRAKGGKVLAKYKGFWQVELPLGQISSVAKNSIVDFVRLPLSAQLATPLGRFQISGGASEPFPQMEAQQGLIISEGVALIGADVLQSQGERITGQGVRVAVIDLTFDRLDEIVQRDELPESLVAWNCLGDPTDPGEIPVCRQVSPEQLSQVSRGSPHGTAVAEIIHDVAPDAELHLFLVNTAVELGQALEQALREGVQVVNHSVGWFNDGSFYDGQGKIGDIVRAARQNGIFWVNAAGNAAQEHYETIFKDQDGDKFHDEVIRFELQEGEKLTVQASWDSWPATDEDFDMILEQVNREVGGSRTLQNGTEPTERFLFEAPATDTYRLRIRWADANVVDPPTDRKMELFLFTSLLTSPQPNTPESSLPAPANAREAFAVGAIGAQQWLEGKLQPFSSWGPSNNGLTKPDLVGPDCVRTASFEESISRSFCGDDGLFSGTSAAAPHVAGMAALLLSKDPSLTPRALEKQLKDCAEPIPQLSENQGGAGRASLLCQTDLPDLTLEMVEIDTSEVLEDGPVLIQVKIKNVGMLDARPFWIVLWRAEEEGATGSELVSRFLRDGLKAGEEQEILLEWFPPPGGLKGECLVVVVDPFGDVGEREKGNNRKDICFDLGPVLEVDADSLSFSGQEGDRDLSAQSFIVRNVGGQPMEWSASANESWITLSETRGTLEPNEEIRIEVGVTTDELSAGPHEGSITIVALDAQGSKARITVNLTLVPRPAELEVSPASLSFFAEEGGSNPDSQTLTLRNVGGQSLNWAVFGDEDWLNLSRSSGQLLPDESESIQVSANISSLTAGSHEAEITVTSTDTEVEDVRVSVTLTLDVPTARLEAAPVSLSFSGQEGGTNPSDTLIITNSGGALLEWQITANASWILPGVTGGTLEAGQSFELTVFINTQDLTAGTHEGKITVSAPGADNSPIQTDVTLTLSSS